MSSNDTRSLTYREAGVDVAAGNALARWIAKQAKTTHRPEVVGGIGGFAGLCGLPPGMREPLLVAATDGVGTKLKIAFAAGMHRGVGIDLVAMSVNDLITVGASPLFFLDYFATGALEPAVARDVLGGIVAGCQQAGCALLGGETAEMPGMYRQGEYDLAGFAVGVVEREAVIDGGRIRAGDAVIGLPSSGLHSNGFSLVRKALDLDHLDDWTVTLDGCGSGSVADVLLAPTRIYVDAIKRLSAAVDVHGLVHVTGGGLIENPPRGLPAGLGYRFYCERWQVPAVFRLIQQRGRVAESEMRRTFNMGLGMLAVVPVEQVEAALGALGEGRQVGEIVARLKHSVEFVE